MGETKLLRVGATLVVILPDFEIARLCKEENLLTPFDPDLINPASIDIRLGDLVMMEEPRGNDFRPKTIAEFSRKRPFRLWPGEFVLAQSLEIFNVPNTIAGQFALKSSVARMGFEHLLAGWIDPGFHGSVLTLELKNARTQFPVPLWPGMRIGQIVWHRMMAEPNVSYKESGRYNNDSVVTRCKGL